MVTVPLEEAVLLRMVRGYQYYKAAWDSVPFTTKCESSNRHDMYAVSVTQSPSAKRKKQGVH